MVARPRTYKITTPNLYCKLDKRAGKVHWQYKYPIFGRFHSLGTDEAEAKQVASEANMIIIGQCTGQTLGINERLTRIKGSRTDTIVSSWLDRHESAQEERSKHNELRPNSF